MSTPILPLRKTATVSYGDRTISNFWRVKQGVFFCQDLRKELLKLIDTAKGLVCIQSDILTDKELMEAILRKKMQNEASKFFILANNPSPELQKLAVCCTIRYELQNVGAFVLVNVDSGSPSGLFFAGKLTENGINEFRHASVSLNLQHIQTLFHYFSFHFQKTAQKELVVSKEQKTLDNLKGKGLKSLLFDLGAAFVKELAKEAANRIVPPDTNPNPNPNPNPKKEEQSNPKEAAYSDQYFSHTLFFDFVRSAKRSELANKSIFLLSEESKPLFIKQSSTVDYGEFKSTALLPMSDFRNKKPEFKDDGVSVSIKYEWKDLPYYLPDGATKYVMDANWQNDKAAVMDWIDSVMAEIEAVLNMEMPTAKRLLLSKKIAVRGTKEDLEAIKRSCNFEKNISQKNIERINKIQHKIRLDTEEIKLESEINHLKTAISEAESKDNRTEIQYLKEILQGKQAQKADILQEQESTESSTLDDFLGGKTETRKRTNKDDVPDYHPKASKTGKLFTYNQKLYLAIDFWEQYEEGKKEAERLNDILCTTKN